MKAFAVTFLAAAALLSATAQADNRVDACAAAAVQMTACKSPPLAALAQGAAETHCCEPFLQLLISDCFWCASQPTVVSTADYKEVGRCVEQ